MSDQRLNTALGRIAAALDRIEQVADRPLPQTESSDTSAAELASLQERHAKLKEEATIALSALDAVLARASAGARS
ncbi:MAG: hypothetical protein RLZZ561_873 [Pseudomonadota bacterium]|jgi:hypothetical protein